MLISAVQQSDSVIHIYILFHILFHYGLSQDIEYSSLCYTVGTLFIHSIYNSLHLLNPNSQSILPSPLLPLGNHKSILYVCESVSVDPLFYIMGSHSASQIKTLIATSFYVQHHLVAFAF